VLGSELRDVFDAYPPRPMSEDERAAFLAGGPTAGLSVFTGGRRDAAWPYGIEWLGDAYPKPHWVKVQEEERRAQAAAAAAAAGSGGGGSGGGGGGSVEG
jgi:hypothetical protein